MQILTLYLSALLAVWGHHLWAQEVLHTASLSDQLRSLRCQMPEHPTAPPSIALGSGEQLLLSFDDLSDQPATYAYRLVHCDSKWQASRLHSSEYIDGYADAPIAQQRYAQNTLQSYTHYQVLFPTDELRPRLSGNYLIEVFAADAPEHTLLRHRFRVCEQLVQIEAWCPRPDADRMQRGQQAVELRVLHPNLRIDNPYDDLYVLIEQNQNSERALGAPQPSFVQAHRVDFLTSDATTFPGGNEFRSCNLLDIRQPDAYTESIRYEAPSMVFVQKPATPRGGLPYAYAQDLNGAYHLGRRASEQPEVEADYVWVDFRLNAPRSAPEGNYYVFGALSHWQLLPQLRMHYNEQAAQWQLRTLLKQGYYDYMYAFADAAHNMPDLTKAEGSFYQTENDYYVYVYHRNWELGYDRLVASRRINSIQKL